MIKIALCISDKNSSVMDWQKYQHTNFHIYNNTDTINNNGVCSGFNPFDINEISHSSIGQVYFVFRVIGRYSSYKQI